PHRSTLSLHDALPISGDIYQVNLAQRFRTSFPGAPLELYGRVRARNPAPFGAYLALGDLTIASISPERFLRLDGAARTVEARPIDRKSTRLNSSHEWS